MKPPPTSTIERYPAWKRFLGYILVPVNLLFPVIFGALLYQRNYGEAEHSAPAGDLGTPSVARAQATTAAAQAGAAAAAATGDLGTPSVARAQPQHSQTPHCAIESASPGNTTIVAGRITVTIPSHYRIATGVELESLRTEVGGALDQMSQRYQRSTGAGHPSVGIKHFAAAELPERTGWFIVHEFVLPPQKDYFAQMQSDSKEKIEWGRQQGIFESVDENGVVVMDGKKVFRTSLRHKNGGRSITVAYWSPKTPGTVSQIMVVQERQTGCVGQEIDRALATTTIL